MSKREDIDERLVYTCNCGWLDKGHANSKNPGRPNIGAASLWDQVQNEKGRASDADPNGFKVTYAQDMKKWVMTDGYYRSYFVKKGLSTPEKEKVALAIFMEVSVGFESMQSSWPYSWVTDSGFSVEDLVSDLIGFYKTVRPSVDYVPLCKPVSKDASLAIWDKFGSVGSKKNNTFRPIFYECEECKKQGITPKFPDELLAIEPAKKGTTFRDWKYTITQVPDKDADEIIPTPIRHYR